MKKSILMVLMFGIVALTSVNAYAIVVADINGYDNGEWISPNLSAIDPNEGFIDDRYDIWKLAMIIENNGNADDGLYVGWLLYDTPTFAVYPSAGAKRPSYVTLLDLNANGIEDSADLRIDYFWTLGSPAPVLTLSDLSLNILGTGTAVMGTSGANAGVEWFISKSAFPSFPLGNFQTYSQLDNGGEPSEDFIPDRGWSTTVPEPASAMLLVMGMAGVAGALRRKFMA